MKILKKILYFILVLSALFCGFLLLCAVKPEMKDEIAGFFHPNNYIQKTVESAQVNGLSEENPLITENNQDSSNQTSGNSEAVNSEAVNSETGIAENPVSDYSVPDQKEISIPKEVSGRNGYQQIQDEQELVDEAAAERLADQLDVGNTGDDLNFDAEYYPYYAMLDENGKRLYRQIYANADGLYALFAPVVRVSPEQLKNIFSAVFNDHPELFWLETAYSGKYTGDGQCVGINLKFNRTAQNLESEKAQFEENANQILSEAQQFAGDYEKEKYVHDALLNRITYNLGAEMNQSAYSALINGQTVCAGYARAFQYLMQRLEIPCYYCTGYAGESHAWNIIKLDESYYNVDTTWDDTGSSTYDYFNKTDSDYATTHIRQDLSVYLPACNGQTYRNLEKASEESSLRSLEEVGMTEEQVLTDMQKYYEDCNNQIVQNGIGSYTFYNVIEGEQMLDEWYQNYQNKDYGQAYMENAMTEIGASSCEMSLGAEELQGGRYLIIHNVSVG